MILIQSTWETQSLTFKVCPHNKLWQRIYTNWNFCNFSCFQYFVQEVLPWILFSIFPVYPIWGNCFWQKRKIFHQFFALLILWPNSKGLTYHCSKKLYNNFASLRFFHCWSPPKSKGLRRLRVGGELGDLGEAKAADGLPSRPIYNPLLCPSRCFIC